MALGNPLKTASDPESGVNVNVKFVGSGSAEGVVAAAQAVASAATRIAIVVELIYGLVQGAQLKPSWILILRLEEEEEEEGADTFFIPRAC